MRASIVFIISSLAVAPSISLAAETSLKSSRVTGSMTTRGCSTPLLLSSDVARTRRKIVRDLKQAGVGRDAIRLEVARYDARTCTLR